MNDKSPVRPFVIAAATFVSFFSVHCRKSHTDRFCEVQRAVYQSLHNKSGSVVYSTKFNRYGVSFSETTGNNIDSQTIGYVCSLPQELQHAGLPVIVSGTLKRFNQEENIQPETGGQELYYLETIQIVKKP